MACGRGLAFHIANLFWVICGILLFCVVPVFPKDEARLNELMRERAKRMAGTGASG